MQPRRLPFLLLSILVLALLLAAAGWRLASRVGRVSVTAPAAQAAKAKAPDNNIPVGDPVDVFRAAKTTEARAETLGRFMALGHERNPAMLTDALRDPDVKLRLSAVEYTASLTPLEACEVYRASCINDQSDIREMTWSLLAPHPEANRALVYGQGLAKGTPQIIEETLSEMGRQPGRILFEEMLNQTLKSTEPARTQRLLRELQQWLVPGGGEIPQFPTPNAVAGWWERHRTNYDEYMLRVDL